MKLSPPERDILKTIWNALEEKKISNGLGETGRELILKMQKCIDERLNIKEIERPSLPYDKTLVKKLNELGLSGNQSKVFAALIAIDKGVTAVTVSRALDIPRTETYHLLNWLLDRKLIYSESWHDNDMLHSGGYGKMYFVANPQESIRNFIKSQTDDIENQRDQVLECLK